MGGPWVGQWHQRNDFWRFMDFDVHHGNSTEDIVAGDERILMVGFFQHPLYPYSGAVSPAASVGSTPRDRLVWACTCGETKARGACWR